MLLKHLVLLRLVLLPLLLASCEVVAHLIAPNALRCAEVYFGDLESIV